MMREFVQSMTRFIIKGAILLGLVLFKIFVIMKIVSLYSLPQLFTKKEWFGVLCIIAIIRFAINKEEIEKKPTSAKVFIKMAAIQALFLWIVLCIAWVVHFY